MGLNQAFGDFAQGGGIKDFDESADLAVRQIGVINRVEWWSVVQRAVEVAERGA